MRDCFTGRPRDTAMSATIAIANQVFEVSRALGHANIGTTSAVYAHWTEAMAARTAERMSEILGG